MSRAFDAALFCTLAVLWGLSFPAIAVGLEYLPPLLFAAARYDVAALLLLAYAAVRLEEWVPRRRNDQAAILGGGLFLVAGNGLLFVGQQTVPSGVAAVMNALIPIVTAVWAFLVLGERLSKRGVVGVLIGFLGIAFVVQPDPTDLLAGGTVGRLLIVGQVASVALGGVLVQRAAPTIGRVPLTGWSMLVGALALHLASAGIGETATVTAVTPTALAMVGYLGVFSTALAFFIYFSILEEYGAFEAALVAYLVPIVATVVGVVALNESLDALTVVGFLLVVVGFAILKRNAIADALDPPTGLGRP
ncbi:DMT family transporter [Natronobiforma cellulositropha]|uniref:DMT family transporter n=1 Tax=Natronobiforma cellulositropha TaxID=1679076 RepID=UPI0021D5F510|nr:EamA family transporter [Natronobiforma cellulositropha]